MSNDTDALTILLGFKMVSDFQCLYKHSNDTDAFSMFFLRIKLKLVSGLQCLQSMDELPDVTGDNKSHQNDQKQSNHESHAGVYMNNPPNFWDLLCT